eukprot:PhF_6_TR33841/c0_g1_i2/m.49633/K18183/COX19; cytochrome c oxidase assembly protein subunit 19
MAMPPPKRPPPKAPELGAFPVDHLRECKPEIAKYYRCLEQHEYLAPKCRDDVREYLKCRMDKGLMAQQDIDKFGLPKTTFVETRVVQKTADNEAAKTGVSQVGAVLKKNYWAEMNDINDGYEAVKKTK